MKFNPSHLDDFQQTLFILNVKVFIGSTFILELEPSDVGAWAAAGVPLKKALFINTGRAAQQAQRAPCDSRQDPGRHGGVVFGELAFGDVSGFGITRSG